MMTLTLKEAGKSFTLCGSMSGERETVAYMSTSERLTVSVISRNDAEVPRNFLLNYTGTAQRRRLAHDSHTTKLSCLCRVRFGGVNYDDDLLRQLAAQI